MSIPTGERGGLEPQAQPLGSPDPRQQPYKRPRAEQINGPVWRTTGGTFETRDYQPGGQRPIDNGQRMCSNCAHWGLPVADECDYCVSCSMWEART